MAGLVGFNLEVVIGLVNNIASALVELVIVPLVVVILVWVEPSRLNGK